MSSSQVNHPSHYNSEKFPVECITVVQGMKFCLGNAVKYVWRHEDKGNPVEDLEKALWYLDRCEHEYFKSVKELNLLVEYLKNGLSYPKHSKRFMVSNKYFHFFSALKSHNYKQMKEWIENEVNTIKL